MALVKKKSATLMDKHIMNRVSQTGFLEVIERSSIIKYRSSLNLEIIGKILTELWPFFDIGLASILVSVRTITFEEVHHYHSKFTEG